jgi:hypothetical protein
MEANQDETGQPALGANGRALTDAEIRALPPVVDLTTAARILGVGTSAAYQLARTGRWPTPILRFGRKFRVPTAPMLALIEIDSAPVIAKAPMDSVASTSRLPWHDRNDLGHGL